MGADVDSELSQLLPCPLCSEEKVSLYHIDRLRRYYLCSNCRLVFVSPDFHLHPNQEKKEYDHHENSVTDEGYLKFLSRFSTPFLDTLGNCKAGLDYGCGPAPALAMQMERAGHSVALYDPMYRDDKSVLSNEYDFISSTEVVEHFRSPQTEFALLFDILKNGGLLGIMTKLIRDQTSFKSWHYIRDPTHICFYSEETFHFIAEKYGAEVSFIGNDVIFLRKNS
ncbi:class I SAM-dependent methyltransferase [Desulforhopalus sp. 52FAK]